MMKINIEFTGGMDEIMKDFSALGSILSAVKTEEDQHPYLDATPEVTTKPPEAATPVPETPQAAAPANPEPVSAAAPEPPVVPKAPVKEYTLDELLTATAPLMDAGKIADLQALMQKSGAVSMMDIPKECYGELATDLRALGARL